MLSYSKLKSHPSKSLEEHLLNVACNCESFCKNLSINDKNLYTQISFFIGLCHDFAKSTTFFQEYLNDGKKSQLKNHGFLSAVFGYYVVKNYLSKNNISFDLDLSSLTYLVILRHHGDFKNISGLGFPSLTSSPLIITLKYLSKLNFSTIKSTVSLLLEEAKAKG